MKRILWACIVLFLGPATGGAQVDPENPSAYEQARIADHVYGGLPGRDHVYVRNGYVLGYNPATRTPSWVAYTVTPDYRNTPRREGPFKRFRNDPDIDNEPADREYVGLLDARGYARGHLAPYAVMGGDRDGDGQLAVHNPDDSSDVGDPDDALTVFESNYMSNIAPQHHAAFNSGERVDGEYRPGLWYELERWIQDELVVAQNRRVWVFAGCVFGPGEHEKVGPNEDIWVPPMFFKIVLYDEPGEMHPVILAYLFPHQRVRHGDLNAFLVSVDTIEALTGLDFFPEWDDLVETTLEDRDTWLNTR